MKHRYLPMTESDQKAMLEKIGVSSVEELFSDIPESVRFKGEYKIKPAKSETALLKELTKMAQKMLIFAQIHLSLVREFMIITCRSLSIMFYPVQSFILPILLTSRKFPRRAAGNFRISDHDL